MPLVAGPATFWYDPKYPRDSDRAVGNLPLGGLGAACRALSRLSGMVVSPGVLSHAEGRGLHDPNRRTGGVVRRRRVDTLGAHELVAGNVLVIGGDDPRCETIGT